MAETVDPQVPALTDPEAWTALGHHFRSIGLTREFAAARQRDCDAYPAFTREDRLLYLYRNDPQPASLLMLLFTARQPCSVEAASTALSQPLFELACRSGLLLPHTDGVTSPFLLQLINELYLFVDYPTSSPQRIMAVGPTTHILAGSAYPQQPVNSALDMGCGCGILALLLASAAHQVTGVDINPRAVAISRLNAALNGISNVAFLESDLFSALEDQRFDWIVAQPPFVSRLPEEEPILYLHGGERGDEISFRLLEQLPAHLAPGGSASVLSDFCASEGQPFSQQLPRTPGFHTSVFLYDDVISLEMQAASYLSKAKFLSSEVLWLQTAKSVEHLRSLGVDHLRQALIVVRAICEDGLSGFSLAYDKWHAMNRKLIDSLFDVMPLSNAAPEDLLPLRLRVPAGTQCRQDFSLLDGRATFQLQPANSSLLANPSATEHTLALLQAVHAAENVSQALRGLRANLDEEYVLRATRLLQQLLLHGILEVQPTNESSE